MKGNSREVRPGVWQLTFDLPKGGDGKRKQKKVTFHGGARAAQKELSRLITEAGAGRIAAPNKTTVEAYLTDWLAKRVAEGLSPKTCETWGYIAGGYIIPHIGGSPLTKLSAVHIEALYATLRKSGRRKGPGGVSSQTVLHVHRLLSEVLESAVRLEIIPANPCKRVVLRTTPTEERPTLAPEAFAKLLTASKGTWLHLPLLLASGLGFRRGECLGLRWQDVDLTSGSVTVAQTLQQLRGSGLFYKEPKSKSSRRTLRLPEFITAELRQVRIHQMEHSIEMGERWQDSGLVIQKEDDGSPRTPDNLTHAFAKLAEKVGVPEIHFHDLRHFNATLLLLAKVDTKIVSARLGHSSTTITRDLYQHVLPAMDAEAADRTDDFFRGAFGA